jgi:hypothetical protein
VTTSKIFLVNEELAHEFLLMQKPGETEAEGLDQCDDGR